MTARPYDAVLDAELERIAGLSGNAQREAALALVALQGVTRGTQAHAINGSYVSLRMVRDESGRLQVDSIVRYAGDDGRAG
jgi:hypothetical protein